MAQHPRFKDLEVSCGHIRERCQMFVDADLPYREHHGIYEITTWGPLYLEGEIEAENQLRPWSSRIY